MRSRTIFGLGANRTLTAKSVCSYARLYGLKRLIKAASVQVLREVSCLFDLFNVDVVEVKASDVSYRLHVLRNDRGISRDLRIFGIWEPFWIAYMLVAIRSGMAVVDVGANLGYYTILMSRLVEEAGGVTALEPDPVNFSVLLQNIELNGAGNVQPYNCAASNINGRQYLSRSKYASGWSTISATPRSGADIGTETVRLDDFLPTVANRLDIVKLDIEGHEIEAIDGMRRMIKDLLPTIFIELHFEENAKRNKLGEMLEMLNFLDEHYAADFVIPRRLNNHYVGSMRDARRSPSISSLSKLSPYGQLSVVMKPR